MCKILPQVSKRSKYSVTICSNKIMLKIWQNISELKYFYWRKHLKHEVFIHFKEEVTTYFFSSDFLMHLNYLFTLNFLGVHSRIRLCISKTLVISNADYSRFVIEQLVSIKSFMFFTESW